MRDKSYHQLKLRWQLWFIAFCILALAIRLALH